MTETDNIKKKRRPKKPIGYWENKNNRLKELDDYIKNVGNINNMTLAGLGKYLYHNLNPHEGIFELAKELGYDLNKIYDHTVPNYYTNDFSKIEVEIRKFIIEHNRFPSKMEIIKNLKIGQRNIDHFGGIYELKRKMEYFDDSDLVDDRRFVNKSLLEFMVAQFLIYNDVEYIREKIIPNQQNRSFRTDFYLVDHNIYVEVWGYDKNDSKISKSYHKAKDAKMIIYNSGNMDLISVFQKDIEIHNFKNTYNTLSIIFADIISSLKKFEEDIFISTKTISDEEILLQLESISESCEFLPNLTEIKDGGLAHLSRIIRKRHSDYFSFAEKYGKKIKHVSKMKKYLTKEQVFSALEELMIYKKSDISGRDVKDSYGGAVIYKWIVDHGGIDAVKIIFYLSIIDKTELFDSSKEFVFSMTLKNHPDHKINAFAKELTEKLISNSKNKSLYYKYKIFRKMLTEIDYLDNFHNTATDGYSLTPAGFNEVSEIGFK